MVSVMSVSSRRSSLYLRVSFAASTQIIQESYFPLNISSPYSKGHRISLSSFGLYIRSPQKSSLTILYTYINKKSRYYQKY